MDNLALFHLVQYMYGDRTLRGSITHTIIPYPLGTYSIHIWHCNDIINASVRVTRDTYEVRDFQTSTNYLNSPELRDKYLFTALTNRLHSIINHYYGNVRHILHPIN